MQITNEQEPQDEYQAIGLDRPTVGQLHLPAAVPQAAQPAPFRHPPQPIVLHLDLLPSDGDGTKWKPHFPGHSVEAPDVARATQFVTKFCGQQDLQALFGMSNGQHSDATFY